MTHKIFKSTLLSLAIVASNSAVAQQVTIEQGAMITGTSDVPRAKLLEVADPAVGMIRASGYRCDSISAMRPFVFSVGFTVVCNGFRYEYDIEDRGGNWTVELQ